MKLFNNHSGLRGLPCLAEGIYWATGLSRTTPFTEGRLGVNNKASPPGRHQEQAPKQRCTFSPTTFSSVQFSTQAHILACFRTCDLLAQISVGPPSAARARGSGADRNPTWQLFTPAWHVPLWSDRVLSFKVPSICTFPRMPAAKLD